MSQTATLQLIPDSAVESIRAAIEPRKIGWLRKPKDEFWPTLHGAAQDILNLQWSGYAVIVLFEFMREARGFDIAAAENHPLAELLSRSRHSYFAVFTPDLAQALLSELASAEFSETEMTVFANEFSETSDDDAGKPLLGAARAIQKALAQVRPGNVGLLHVG